MKRATRPVRGVIAALLLPRDEHDQPIWSAFERNARFVAAAGVSGFCVNGATGEYVGATAEERNEAVMRARAVAGDHLTVLSGAGGSRLAETAQFTRDAELAGADAALVPAPHFFKYEQDDLAEFYRRIAAQWPIPILIYNLPAFTGGLDPRLVAELIRDTPGIVGVKDSSGEIELLSYLTGVAANSAIRMVGNDAVLAEALENGLCDGAVSGIAGVAPELTVGLWRAARARDWNRLHILAKRQEALISKADAFPTPWGLKLIAEIRGLAPANTAIPLSAARRRQAEQFREWFAGWWAEAESEFGPLAAEPDSNAA